MGHGCFSFVFLSCGKKGLGVDGFLSMVNDGGCSRVCCSSDFGRFDMYGILTRLPSFIG